MLNRAEIHLEPSQTFLSVPPLAAGFPFCIQKQQGLCGHERTKSTGKTGCNLFCPWTSPKGSLQLASENTWKMGGSDPFRTPGGKAVSISTAQVFPSPPSSGLRWFHRKTPVKSMNWVGEIRSKVTPGCLVLSSASWFRRLGAWVGSISRSRGLPEAPGVWAGRGRGPWLLGRRRESGLPGLAFWREPFGWFKWKLKETHQLSIYPVQLLSSW